MSISRIEGTLLVERQNAKCAKTSGQLPLARVPVPGSHLLSAPEMEVEGDMHDQFIQWLNVSEIHFIHFRMDKKSPIPGLPDFTCHKNRRVAFIEFKCPGKEPTPVQSDYFTRLELFNTCKVYVAHSVTEAAAHVRQELFLWI